MVREGTGNRGFLIYPLIYSNKLAYLQLITISGYGLLPNPNFNGNPKPNPNPNREANFLGGNCPDTICSNSK